MKGWCYVQRGGFYKKSFVHFFLIIVLGFLLICSVGFNLGQCISTARQNRAQSQYVTELEQQYANQNERIRRTTSELTDIIQTDSITISDSIKTVADLRKTMQDLENQYNDMLRRLSDINSRLCDSDSL